MLINISIQDAGKGPTNHWCECIKTNFIIRFLVPDRRTNGYEVGRYVFRLVTGVYEIM